jgi:hypothetical protein
MLKIKNVLSFWWIKLHLFTIFGKKQYVFLLYFKINKYTIILIIKILIIITIVICIKFHNNLNKKFFYNLFDIQKGY